MKKYVKKKIISFPPLSYMLKYTRLKKSKRSDVNVNLFKLIMYQLNENIINQNYDDKKTFVIQNKEEISCQASIP